MKLTSLFFLVTALIAGCSRNESVPDKEQSVEAAGLAHATITSQAARDADIEVATAGPGVLHETLTLYGVIQTDPEHVRAVTARYPGVIHSVTHQIGDPVAVNETLATVESNESLQTYLVKSPIAGVITQRHANPGEVAQSEPLFEVADFSTVRAELSVFPKDRARLKVGQKLRVTTADGDIKVDGLLSYVAPNGNLQNQTITARAMVANRDGRWTPGQFVTADVVINESQAKVSVAESALQNIKGHTVVFVQIDKGFEARPVEVGKRGSGTIEIANGLNVGEQYVAKNSFIVKAEVLKSEAEAD